MILASGTDVPHVLPELVALVVAAALIGYVSSRLRVVPIVGFLLAGVVVGPHQLGLVEDQDVVDVVAEVGVILLLFTIGLEFSLERLNRIRRQIVVGGGLQVLLAAGVTAGLAYTFGVPGPAAVFTGLLLSLSSTAIVLKLLAERHEGASPHGQAATAVLLFQDLAVVVMVLLVPILGDSGSSGDGGGMGEIPIALGKAALLIVGVLVIARRLMPPLLDIVARTCAPEVFLLTIVAICFGTALASAELGVSLSLGAFLAGMVVSESRHRTHAFAEILPLQILFSAAFFVSVGMLLDAQFLLDEPLTVLGCVVGIVVIKSLTGTVALAVVGTGVPVALGAGLMLAQVGEFSFVLDQVGRDAGLSALDLGDDGSQALIAATVILMIASPALAAAGNRLQRRMDLRMAARGTFTPAAEAEEPGARTDHALVLGYGDAARAVIGELRRHGLEITVLTLNPDGATQASEDGLDVIVGDYTKQAVLHEAGADRATLAVVADDELERTIHAVTAVRTLNPDATIVTRPLNTMDAEELAAAGADHVVTAERASHIGLEIAIRAALGAGTGATPLSTVIEFRPDPDAQCRHLSQIRVVQPSAYGCEDCLRINSTWVHLRICLSCGHVGCCDSSQHKHARKHAGMQVGTAAHPLIAGLEPGDGWAYCFLDDETINPARVPQRRTDRRVS